MTIKKLGKSVAKSSVILKKLLPQEQGTNEGAGDKAFSAVKEASIKGLAMFLEQACRVTFVGQIVMQQSEDSIEGPKAAPKAR